MGIDNVGNLLILILFVTYYFIIVDEEDRESKGYLHQMLSVQYCSCIWGGVLDGFSGS